MSIGAAYNKIVHNLIENTNPFLGNLRRQLGGVNFNFTIISNNCWAGSVYRWLNLPYMTPTAGLYFYAEDYIDFLSNLKENCSIEVKQLKIEESRHKEQLLAKGQQNVPIGIIRDIEIIFLHYPTFEEAKEKWERRCKRINWERLIIKNAEMNNCTPEMVMRFDDLPFENKFIFTTRNYGIQSQVVFKEYIGKDQVRDDTTLFNKYINCTKLVKGEPFKRKQ